MHTQTKEERLMISHLCINEVMEEDKGRMEKYIIGHFEI